MSKYHITRSGKPARCLAIKRSCPLGEHYETKQEAYDAMQSKMSDEYGVLSGVSDDNSVDQDNLKEKYKNQYRLVKMGKFKSREDEELERTQLAKYSSRLKEKNSEVTNLRDLFKDFRKLDTGAAISISTKNNQKAIIATSGFCASPYPEYSKTFNSVKEINHASILEFMDNIEKEKQDIFLEKDVYIGLWKDPKSNKIQLDLSKRYNSAKDARIACERSNQSTYFDLQVLENVNINKR